MKDQMYQNVKESDDKKSSYIFTKGIMKMSFW